VHLKSTFSFLLLAISLPLHAQVAPSATGSSTPFSVGVGFSNFDMDWGHNRMDGGTLWVDWNPTHVPRYLRGLGLELEARDINIDHSGMPANFRTDTLGGGPTYTWRHFRKFEPYAKAAIDDGNIDFRASNTTVTHINWTVYAVGGGVNYRLSNRISLRADYEFQAWSDMFRNNKVLNPQGFTFGVLYNIGHLHSY
jgi:opacity protein-like surface antigen